MFGQQTKPTAMFGAVKCGVVVVKLAGFMFISNTFGININVALGSGGENPPPSVLRPPDTMQYTLPTPGNCTDKSR